MPQGRSNAPSRLDWDMVARDVVRTPGMTLYDAAEKYGVAYETMRIHGGPKSGNWLAQQKRNTAELVEKTDSRTIEILAQNKADDIAGLEEIRVRLQRGTILFFELLFPPADSPEEVLEAAWHRREKMSGKQLAESAASFARCLAETGRHIRLLTGQSTFNVGRALPPGEDLMLPDTLEQAQALEARSRQAQKALKAIGEGRQDSAANEDSLDVAEPEAA